MRLPAHRLVIGVLLAGLLASGAVACTGQPDGTVGTATQAGGGSTGPGGSPGASPGAALPLVVDTDMAPDDITAIASLARDPNVDLRAITVSGTGEAHCPGGLFVARSLVTMLVDHAVPVACGNGSPLGPAEAFPTEWRAAVDAGSGLQLVRPAFVPDPRAAADLIVELARTPSESGERLTILTLGTLTNVATALAADPDLPTRVRLVSMLGAVRVAGNVTTQPGAPSAEWNAHADPTAVRRVLEAGFDWTLVPLDATNSVPLTAALMAELQADHAAAPADVVFELWAKNPYMTAGGFYLWDPLASVVARDPTVVTAEPMRLAVTEGDGIDGGRLREDPSGHSVSVAVAADQTRFEALLLDRLRRGPARPNAFNPTGTIAIAGGSGRCTVTFDPAQPRAGLQEVDLHNDGSEPVNVVVFELGPVDWAEVSAFVATYDPAASPPPVVVVAQVAAGAGSTATAYGDLPAGSLGAACFTGTPDDASIVLAGPFAIAP